MLAEAELREAFCEIGRRVWQRGFVASNDGNFSFRLDENRVLCTPTLLSKGFMRPEDMIVVDLDGNQIEGTRRATSEIRIHLFIYRNRPGIHSVVHVHPPHATAFAVARRQPPPGILPEAEVMLGEIPLTPYALAGTWNFAETIKPWVLTHDVFLLASHGALTLGLDPFDAYYRMETLEQYCRILLLAGQAGGIKSLGDADHGEILDFKRKLGLRDARLGTPASIGPFRPHPGPLRDEPKMAACPAGERPASRDLLTEEIIREVRRRLGI